MNTYWFFLLAFSLLLCHEMDAIRRHEWKIFPLLSRIKDDEQGYIIFTAIHIPLYVFLLSGLFSNGATVNESFIVGFDIFCIVHVLLHLLLMKHPQYQFNNWFSWVLIWGAGIAGGLDLLLRV